MALNVLATGIEFTPQGGSSVNLLDDYEEGTWTPAPVGGSSIQNTAGGYTKTGRNCYVSWYSGTLVGDGSDSIINGLPFTVMNVSYGYAVFSNSHDTWSNGRGGYCQINNTGIVMVVNDTPSGATSDNDSGNYIMISGNYIVA